MTCCAPGATIGLAMADAAQRGDYRGGDHQGGNEELRLASRDLGDGLRQNDLSVPGIHCGACIQRIERALHDVPGVAQARVNLSTKRVAVRWRGETPPPIIPALEAIGYDAHLFDAGSDEADPRQKDLMRALAVAGFASGNIMMLSMAVWAGADATTRDIFHWLSALIAGPTMIYAGRIFFRSAWQALRHGQTNMDVPISIGVLLAFGLSLYETVGHGAHAYFDAATSLLFFLLIGRTLDHMMRERARSAVKGLARLAARGALQVLPDGGHAYLPVGEIQPGMLLLLAAGERVPVDAEVISGQSEIDRSLVSGESLPQPVLPGALLQAGTLNLSGPLNIRAMRAATESFLAEMTRMMEAAEAGRSHYRRIADRAARLYAPVIHLTALATCIGWFLATGDLHRALTIAIAVLIITCPCALGLAVPMVQIVAARRLFEQGIMVRDGSALERLCEADHVAFDKTGTLTQGRPQLLDAAAVDRRYLALAAGMAVQSRHPYSQALVAAAQARHIEARLIDAGAVREFPGAGMEATIEGIRYRLGRPDWAALEEAGAGSGVGAPPASVMLTADGRPLCGFAFQDALRPGAQTAVAALQAAGLPAEILSGDRASVVGDLAARLDIPAAGDCTPAGKLARLSALSEAGRKVLMVGDGLNDAPALMAAHVSMAPASAADIGRNAADFVFLRDSLTAVPLAVVVARRAARLVRQNLMLAIAYNVIAVPVAILGLVTPLIAAIAMSLSSILVVANALRFGRPARRAKRGDEQPGRTATYPAAGRAAE
ncbi:MAG: cadmium-translocating P-type ATPase [Rhodospirillaceae bacterium]|nr:MAG: cadmium-translocating P-type ATPase [Rhodospirillaceae bacterium]